MTRNRVPLPPCAARRLIALAVLLATVAWAPSAAGRGTLDQSTMPAGGFLAVVGDAPDGQRLARAQTFVPGAGGFLDTVAIAASPQSSSDGRYLLTVRGTTAQGGPSGTILATATVDACHLTGIGVTDVAFAPAAQLTAGGRYALVLAPDPSNLPGADVLWNQGQGATNGASFLEALDAPAPAWEADASGPRALSTYMSATAPSSTSRDVTALSLSIDPNPVKRFRPVTVTAQVSDVTHPAAVPAGSVQFGAEGQQGVTVALDAQGRASTTMSWSTAGDRQLVASFCGSDPSLISSVRTATVTVSSAKTATSTTLTATPAAPVAWQPVTFAATVAQSEVGSPPPTGAVQFAAADGTPIGDPVAVDPNGTATIEAAAGAGSYDVLARYNGDDVYDASQGDRLVDVGQAASITRIQSSANPAAAGTTIAWFVAVAPGPPSENVPSGSVAVSVDGGAEASFALDGFGEVALGVRGLPAGSHNVRVRYLGDADYRPSESAFDQVLTGLPVQPAGVIPAPATPSGAPVITALTPSAMLASIHVPAQLVARTGKVALGTVANPPLRSLSVQLAAVGGFRAAAAKPITLGRANVSVSAGARRALVVRLSRAGRRALRAHHRLRVRVRLTGIDTTGHAVKSTLERVLTAARR